MNESPLDDSQTEAVGPQPPASGLQPPVSRLRPTRSKVVIGLALAFAAWGWFDVRLRGAIDPNSPVHKTDFTVYTEAGAAFFDGRDPYKVTNPRGWGYLYPPLFAILVAPLHHLQPTTQVLVWFALSVLMCWGCYRECVRIAQVLLPHKRATGVFGPIPTWVGCAGFAAALFPALNCLQRGQVGVTKLYLLLLGFRLLIESRSAARSFLAGNVLALPVVLKLTPLVPVAMVLFQEFVAAWHDGARRVAIGRAAASSTGTLCGLVVCVFIVPACLVGWSANVRHLDSWYSWATTSTQVENPLEGDNTSVRNQSLTNAAHRFGNWWGYYFAGQPSDLGPEQLRLGGRGLAMDVPVVGALLLALRLLEGGLLLPLAYRLGRTHDALERTVGFALACVSTLVIAPVARGHYYMLFLPAVLFLTVWLLRQHRPRTAVCFAVLPAAIVLAHYAAIDYAGRIGLLGLGTALWFTSAAMILLVPARRVGVQSESRDELLRQHLIPSGLNLPPSAPDRPLAA